MFTTSPILKPRLSPDVLRPTFCRILPVVACQKQCEAASSRAEVSLQSAVVMPMRTSPSLPPQEDVAEALLGGREGAARLDAPELADEAPPGDTAAASELAARGLAGRSTASCCGRATSRARATMSPGASRMGAGTRFRSGRRTGMRGRLPPRAPCGSFRVLRAAPRCVATRFSRDVEPR